MELKQVEITKTSSDEDESSQGERKFATSLRIFWSLQNASSHAIDSILKFNSVLKISFTRLVSLEKLHNDFDLTQENSLTVFVLLPEEGF